MSQLTTKHGHYPWPYPIRLALSLPCVRSFFVLGCSPPRAVCLSAERGRRCSAPSCPRGRRSPPPRLPREPAPQLPPALLTLLAPSRGRRSATLACQRLAEHVPRLLGSRRGQSPPRARGAFGRSARGRLNPPPLIPTRRLGFRVLARAAGPRRRPTFSRCSLHGVLSSPRPHLPPLRYGHRCVHQTATCAPRFDHHHRVPWRGPPPRSPPPRRLSPRRPLQRRRYVLHSPPPCMVMAAPGG